MPPLTIVWFLSTAHIKALFPLLELEELQKFQPQNVFSRHHPPGPKAAWLACTSGPAKPRAAHWEPEDFLYANTKGI